MKNSIHELLFNACLRLVGFLCWIDRSIGIDVSGLLIAMDWPFWFLHLSKFGPLHDLLGDEMLPAPWYWGEVNAELSHRERPWAIFYASNDCPF